MLDGTQDSRPNGCHDFQPLDKQDMCDGLHYIRRYRIRTWQFTTTQTTCVQHWPTYPSILGRSRFNVTFKIDQPPATCPSLGMSVKPNRHKDSSEPSKKQSTHITNFEHLPFGLCLRGIFRLRPWFTPKLASLKRNVHALLAFLEVERYAKWEVRDGWYGFGPGYGCECGGYRCGYGTWYGYGQYTVHGYGFPYPYRTRIRPIYCTRRTRTRRTPRTQTPYTTPPHPTSWTQ